MGDGLFFSVGIVLLFILWVVGGGPTRPISFSGPFITPITNVDQTQKAYGPQVLLGGTISAGGGSVNAGVGAGSSSKNSSAYAGQVFLIHALNGTGDTNPNQEYLSIQASPTVTKPITITGWRLVSRATGASATIPQGVPLLTIGTVTTQPIVLFANTTATITTGFSPVNVSFKTNACTNYLEDQAHYMSCVANHSSTANFTQNTWRIYLNRGVRMWQNGSDTIELRDSRGQIVDSYSY